MEIVNCCIDNRLGEHLLIVQIFESEDEDWGNTEVGGDSLIIENDDIEGDYTIYDVVSDSASYIVRGDEEVGYWITRKAEQSAD